MKAKNIFVSMKETIIMALARTRNTDKYISKVTSMPLGTDGCFILDLLIILDLTELRLFGSHLTLG